ncbi:MAG: restriction endonuclease subunit S [Alphaproteobacteria bacterium]|nr:restriction endonuclease subunit S [Alphaproteobacteria bacterium]
MSYTKYLVKDLGVVITGKTPSTKDPENFSNEIMFITPSDLKQGYILNTSERYISQKGFSSILSNTIDGWSVLVGCIGSDLGNIALSNRKCATNQQINSITKIKPNFNPLYIYYWFKQKKEFLMNIAGSTTTPIINKTSFENIEISLPDITEQNAVAKVLSCIDDKIALNNKINAELEQMAKTLYEYWFVQFDFPDEKGRPYKSANGKMVYNEVLKREIPLGWEVKPLKRLIKHINTGLNPRDNFTLGNGNIKYITVKNITENNLLDFKNCDGIDEVARDKVHNRSDIKVGDILFASITPLGRCYLIENEPNDWDINESVFSIRPDITQISSEYLLMCLTSEYFIKKASNSSTGSIFTGIRIKSLEDMPTIVPPQNIIKQFTAQLKLLLKKKNICFKENINLEEIRDFLLPLLMNGQVTVSSEH